MDIPDVKFPLANVTATIMTWHEGPFLDAVLGVVCPKVAKVLVLEDERPMFGADDPSLVPPWNTREVVDKFLDRNPQFIGVIDFRTTCLPGISGKEREVLRKNESLRIAREEHRTEWAWLVDADEIYTDEQALRLWSLVFSHGVGIVHCSWHTYWRSMRWVVDPPEPFRPAVAVRTDSVCVESRGFTHPLQRIFIDEQLLHHYSYSRTPSDMWRKTRTWTHADEVVPGWFENVFMKWSPEARNLHPTSPPNYAMAKRIEWEIPPAVASHPYAKMEVIHETMKIKAVILHHADPERCERLKASLQPAFDVEIWDSGSPPDKVPIGVDRAFGDIYWTGAWNEIMRTLSDYDAVWMLCCDIELLLPAANYREAIESAMPFGVWSPAIVGRAHPFMKADKCRDQVVSVRNIEGMAIALSGELMWKVGKLVDGSPIGFGQDFWLCFRSRKEGMKNLIDGRVPVHHPPGISYSEQKAHDQMEVAFGNLYGADFRRTVFEYDETFEGNLRKEGTDMTTIFTVDNGWGLADFVRVGRSFPGLRKVVIWKGAIPPPKTSEYEVVPYPGSDVFKSLLDGNAIGFFPKVGVANVADLKDAMAAGIPCVVQVSHAQGLIENERNGFVYQDESWAVAWIRNLDGDPALRAKIRANLMDPSPAVEEPVVQVDDSPLPERVEASESPLVAFITPTFRRATPVLLRCINCCQLQTIKDWEQLVCSDGPEEPAARNLVTHLNDSRVSYHHTERSCGDFGNNVRAEMLKLAKGKYVVFLDDDNLILPEYIEFMSLMLKGAVADFAVCQIVHFGPLNEQATGRAPRVLTGDPVKLYHIDSLQVMADREKFIAAGGWDTEKGYLADGHTYERLAEKLPFIHVRRVLGFHM